MLHSDIFLGSVSAQGCSGDLGSGREGRRSQGVQIRSPDNSFHSPSVSRYFEKIDFLTPKWPKNGYVSKGLCSGPFLGPLLGWISAKGCSGDPGSGRGVRGSQETQIRSPDLSFHSPSVSRYFEKIDFMTPKWPKNGYVAKVLLYTPLFDPFWGTISAQGCSEDPSS